MMAEEPDPGDPLDAIIKISAAGDLKGPAFRKLYTLWQQKRGDRAMPSRKDFDPGEFTELLPFVALGDVEHDPLRVRLRLVGTVVTEAIGYEATGQYLDLMPLMDAGLARTYWAIENKTATLVENIPLAGPGEVYSTYSVLLMPLSNDGKGVNMLLGIFSFGK